MKASRVLFHLVTHWLSAISMPLSIDDIRFPRKNCFSYRTVGYVCAEGNVMRTGLAPTLLRHFRSRAPNERSYTHLSTSNAFRFKSATGSAALGRSATDRGGGPCECAFRGHGLNSTARTALTPTFSPARTANEGSHTHLSTSEAFRTWRSDDLQRIERVVTRECVCWKGRCGLNRMARTALTPTFSPACTE